MSSIMERLKNISTIETASVLSEAGALAGRRDPANLIDTGIPALNVALSGKLDGGFEAGITMWCGASKSFKTGFSLIMAAAFLRKYPEGVLLFYDSEFGAPAHYFKTFGIDPDRVLHVPVTDIEELKRDITVQLKNLSRGERVMILIDSIGNIASNKEAQDAADGKSTVDMTRAKQLKSLFRIITPHLVLKDIPCVVVNHTYKEIGAMYPRDIVSGGCLTRGTPILLNNAIVKPIESAAVDDVVVTRNGPARVQFTWDPDTLAEGHATCYRIRFEDSSDEITCSGEHMFMIAEPGGDTTWVTANEMWQILGRGAVADENDAPAPVINMVTIPQLSAGHMTVRVASVEKLDGIHPVYDITTSNGEYAIPLLESGVIVPTHNTGPYYSAQNIYVVGRRQEKTGAELTGFEFAIRVEKSRAVREKSEIPINVSFERGVNRWSGLLEMALDVGIIFQPAKGWYARRDAPDEKFRASAALTEDFWADIYANTAFKRLVEERYYLSHVDGEDEE